VTEADDVSTLDLNADLGEGFGVWRLGDDEAMLAVVTSANVACGGHAGDPSTMRAICVAAARHDVAVGAQVSYPDLLGFGRRFVDIDPVHLADAVVAQIGALDAFARLAGRRVRYVKPHGALYHACVGHERQAAAVAEAVAALDPDLAVVGLPGSLLLQRAEALGLRAVGEAFADRAYLPDGALVARTEPDAVVLDVDEVVRRVRQLALEGTVRAVDGSDVRVRAATVCLHGDTPGAPELARAVRAGLEEVQVRVRPFCEP
jgi:UPF0271 protein